MRRVITMLRPADGLTVRAQFGLATGFLCIAMIVALAASTALLGQRVTADFARREMAGLAGTMLDNLQHGMFERFHELQLLAKLETSAEVLSIDPDKTRSLLEHIQGALGGYAWVGLANPDGVVSAATKDKLTGTSVVDHEWFQNALQGIFLKDVGEIPVISDQVRTGRGQAEPQFVSISVPLRKDDGTLIGVLGAHIHWQLASDLRSEILAPRHQADGVEIHVLSRDGTILLGPGAGSRMFAPARMEALRAAGSGDFIDESTAMLTGFAVDRGYRDYPGLGWVVVARQPADIAFRPMYLLVWALVGLGIIIAASGIVLALAMARRMTAPIRDLTDAADRIGRDPNCTTFPFLRGPNEVVRLASVLRLLMYRIGFAEQRTLEVENRAEQETQRLNQNLDNLRQLAETDALTGLLNRRALLTLAEHAIADHPGAIGVLMIDIDHFKSINDRYGHAAGDAVIRAVADTMVAAVRGIDRLARFGGEEFVVLVRETDLGRLVAEGERLRRLIEAMSVVHSGDRISVTISCGAAAMADADTTIGSLIERADGALYAAKEQGRNRVCAAPGSRRPGEQAA